MYLVRRRSQQWIMVPVVAGGTSGGAGATASKSGSSTVPVTVIEIDPESTAGAGADGVASVGITESSSVRTLQDRVTHYLGHGINGACVCRISIFGFVLVVIGSGGDGNLDSVVTIGWILFSLPFLCFGLVIIFFILCLLRLGIGAIARGMRGGSLVEAVTGMISTTQGLIVLAAIFDIALYASDHIMLFVFMLVFSVPSVAFFIAILYRIVRAVTLEYIKRWGIILQAKVLQRRRRPRKDDNGMDAYEHQLLVTFDVEAASHQHQPCWRFGYQRVSSSTTVASSVDEEEDQMEMEMELLMCEESYGDLSLHHSHILDEGRPVQPGLVQEKTDDNAIPYTRQSIQKWLTVNESQYDSSDNFVGVSALPCWPQRISVATETLPGSGRTVLEIIFFTSLAAGFSSWCVSEARKMIFDDEDILWHVKVSYILVSILLPSIPLVFMIGGGIMEMEESGSHVPNEIESSPEPELSMIQQSLRGRVAEETETARATPS